jgi:alkylation response protein AidB-like acyl-CoA dehydrogenase
MNFEDTPEQAAFRAEARAWLDANAPKHLLPYLTKAGFASLELGGMDPLAEARAWQKTKQEAGWACLHWPREFGGRGASAIERVIWSEEEGPYAVLSGVFLVGHGMCGPTMIDWATEEAKRERLPRLASGEDIWCQLFSEPDAGSDLAGLRTRATRDGDEWVVNGQKVWVSGAHISQWGILITRTDPNVPKHKGLTMFFVRMDSPGVRVVPIRQANGASGFNEVYFDDVRIPDAHRIGPVNEGWKVSLTTLMHERLSIGAGMSTGFADIFEFCQQFELADGTLAIEDRAVRAKLADWACRQSGLTYTAMRAISALSRGETPGPENSIGKLVAGSTRQEIAMFGLDLQGMAGAIDDPEQSAFSARFQEMLMRAPGTRIEGGSDEILRNIIGERVLGLPEDMRADKGIPFLQIPTG